MKNISLASIALTMILAQAAVATEVVRSARHHGHPDHHPVRTMSCFTSDSQGRYFLARSFERNAIKLQAMSLNKCLTNSAYPNSCRELGCHINVN